MEKEIKDELTVSTKPNGDVLKAMKDYAEIKQTNIEPVGDTIARVNRESRVDMALFQGDIILTKEQADEIIEDIKENKGGRVKRQAFRDEKYPKYLWSNGVNFAFYNATSVAKRVFKRAAAMWSWDTCINFGETDRGKHDR
ncbi:unnamed protein product [Angiostrongylus costaricensis]|uniref:Astacin domain-containing protein n=1 Tax=Angiostrongylus costaricensis TaxID=334426 RepID=A0A0R3PIF0_ANGCS|nr:unnamed protein product [Angiostrongylus costaricensis]